MDIKTTIAIDAMGSDKGPESIISGVDISRERNPSLYFKFFGNKILLEELLSTKHELKKISVVVDSPDVVLPDEKPSQALRKRQSTSMGMAIQDVSLGASQAVVSAGNTGALMAISKIEMRMIKGISRPAMAAVLPHKNGEFVMLDLGANLECSSENLVQFAVMGSVFAKVILGYKSPRIALLNVGTENEKGKSYIQEASDILKKSHIAKDFKGYIEGDKITRGFVDVVVADGYGGNIALKTAEGIAYLCSDYIKSLLNDSILGKMFYLALKPSFLTLRDKLDARKRNGALFLGLNGVVVKSHGGTDNLGFASAVDIASDMIKEGAAEKIMNGLNELTTKNIG